MPDEIKVVHQYLHNEEEGKKVKLIKNGKGYGWEIQCSGGTFDEILKEITLIDQAIRKQFPAQEV